MTKIEINIDIGTHPANLVAESIEFTIKAVTKHQFTNSDDADSVFNLQDAYVAHNKLNRDFFKHFYHWTDENRKEFGLLKEEKK